MTSQVLKCSNCNIVICEILAFIQNKLDVMDEESLLRVCATSFPEEDVAEAKKLLFDSVSKTGIRRRKAGKNRRELEDIIDLFQQTPPEEMPIFVARDLLKLPPVSFDHVDVTRLLKDIVVIQKELRNIQESYASDVKYATVNELQDLKLEIENLKKSTTIPSTVKNDLYVNTHRGAFCMQDSFECNSGPMGLLHGTLYSTPEKADKSDVGKPTDSNKPSCSYASVTATTNQNSRLTHTHGESKRVEARTATAGAVANRTVAKPRWASMPADANNKEDCNLESDWVTVTRHRKKTNARFQAREGRAQVSGSSTFKAADVKIPLYIYNVSKETKVEDISNYIMNKTGAQVTLEKVIMKEEKDYDSYKMYVSKSKLNLFEDDNLWPSGILFRRYIVFNKNRKDSEDKKPSNKNGDEQRHD